VQLEQAALFFQLQLHFSHVTENQENLIGKDIGTPNVISIWYRVLFKKIYLVEQIYILFLNVHLLRSMCIFVKELKVVSAWQNLQYHWVRWELRSDV
jgi:hypothetical protein